VHRLNISIIENKMQSMKCVVVGDG